MRNILLTGLIATILLSGCIQKNVEECSLSLCDCKCYLKGETPEEKTGKICGINCLGEYGVYGCEFKDNKCQEIHSEKTCQIDVDCLQENSKCADGVDPYNFCDNGVCGKRIFVRDPCLDHICPKGEWVTFNETSCFTYSNCATTDCNDNSDKTRDECVNIGSRSEGCLYTILNQSSKYCESDNDCVHLPSVCHEGANECVNKDYAATIDRYKDVKDADFVCTAVCLPCTECYCEDNTCKTKISDQVGCC